LLSSTRIAVRVEKRLASSMNNSNATLIQHKTQVDPEFVGI
jgi:hypothetical protein